VAFTAPARRWRCWGLPLRARPPRGALARWRRRRPAVSTPMSRSSSRLRIAMLAANKVNLNKITTWWPDMLRVAGSLVTNQVRAYDLLRMFGRAGHPTPLGQAFADRQDPPPALAGGPGGRHLPAHHAAAAHHPGVPPPASPRLTDSPKPRRPLAPLGNSPIFESSTGPRLIITHDKLSLVHISRECIRKYLAVAVTQELALVGLVGRRGRDCGNAYRAPGSLAA
jgi:Tn3 transposase DDE domain